MVIAKGLWPIIFAYFKYLFRDRCFNVAFLFYVLFSLLCNVGLDQYVSGICVHFICFVPYRHWINARFISTVLEMSSMAVSFHGIFVAVSTYNFSFVIIFAVAFLLKFLLFGYNLLRISFAFRWRVVVDYIFMFHCLSAIHQDEDDGLDDNQVRSPFGSSFRTFDGTDYSSIGNPTHLHTVLIFVIFIDDTWGSDILHLAWKFAFLTVLCINDQKMQ